MESCSRVKGENGRPALREDEVQRIWKDYFEDLYNLDTQEQVSFNMCDFDGVQRDNHFGGEVKLE